MDDHLPRKLAAILYADVAGYSRLTGQDILHYISMWYNPYRLHSTLGYVSPNNYEARLLEMKNAS